MAAGGTLDILMTICKLLRMRKTDLKNPRFNVQSFLGNKLELFVILFLSKYSGKQIQNFYVLFCTVIDVYGTVYSMHSYLEKRKLEICCFANVKVA